MPDQAPLVLAGYDGSPPAAEALAVGAQLFPDATARVTYVWCGPSTSAELRERLWQRAHSISELMELAEAEGRAEAERLLGDGVALAAAAGWRAEPLLERSISGEGFVFARLAEELEPAAVVVGSRGLSGLGALAGSVSDAVVHYAPVPVLVVPHPLLTEERAAVGSGPILVGHDGSEHADRALATATELFPGRRILAVRVADDPDLEPALPADTETITVPSLGAVPPGRGVADALARAGREHGAAAIVVGSRGRSAKAKVLLGSVAMATLHHAHRPVLVAPDPQRLGR